MIEPTAPGTLLVGWWPLDARRARAAVRRRLALYPPHVIEVAEHCVGQLITKAAEHAGPARTEWLITMLVTKKDDRLIIEVWDGPSPDDRPRLKDDDETVDETEQGTLIVESASATKGYIVDEEGNDVHFEIVIHH